MTDDEELPWTGQQEPRRPLRPERSTHRSSEPIRAPRGLDFVTAALPPTWSHGTCVALLYAPNSDLDDLTPLEWLCDEGSPVLVLLAILTPQELVTRTCDLLGAQLVAFTASSPSSRDVDEWVRGDSEPTEDVLARLSTACCAAALLRQHGPPESVRVWFEASNAHLGGRSPAWVLRQDRHLSRATPVLVTARRDVGVRL